MNREPLEQKLSRILGEVVRDIVREELAALHHADPEEWIPHTAWPGVSRRLACSLARTGRIVAKRKGKTWLARRRDIDAWIASQEPSANDTDDEFADAMVAAAQGRRAAGARR